MTDSFEGFINALILTDTLGSPTPFSSSHISNLSIKFIFPNDQYADTTLMLSVEVNGECFEFINAKKKCMIDIASISI